LWVQGLLNRQVKGIMMFTIKALGWQKKMRIRPERHKSDKKLDSQGYIKAGSGFMGTAAAVCLAGALACSGIFMLEAQATPARLRSADAAVYEQADEGSNTVGNLVEGSTFEYVGDVTAEDGSVWHQVATASGVAGYIKGDKEIEPAQEGSAPEGQDAPGNQDNTQGQEGQTAPEGEGNPESQETPEGEGGNGEAPPEGDEPGEGGGGEADTQTPEEAEGYGGGEGAEEPEAADGEDPEALEDGQPEEGSTEEGVLVADIHGVENLQAKSYALDLSGRIKGKEDIVPVMNMEAVELTGGKTRAGIDLTLLLGVAVLLSCTGTAYIFAGKIRRMRLGSAGKPLPGVGERLHRKDGKKKHSQKRKGRRK